MLRQQLSLESTEIGFALRSFSQQARAAIATILMGVTFHPAIAQDGLVVAQADPPIAAAPADPATAQRWSSQCSASARNAALECSVQQTAAINGRPFASATVRLPPGQPAILVLRVPNEIDLHAGLTIRIDEGAPRATGVETCDNTGCYGRTLLDDATREAMRAGQKLAVTFRGFAQQQDITIPFDLVGFAAEFDAIQ